MMCIGSRETPTIETDWEVLTTFDGQLDGFGQVIVINSMKI